jgi:hypothetical protein
MSVVTFDFTALNHFGYYSKGSHINAPISGTQFTAPSNILDRVTAAIVSIAKTISPYRKSIWRADTRFDLRARGFSDAGYADLALSYGVIDAKLRVPILFFEDCREVVALIRNLPDDPVAVPPTQLAKLLAGYLCAATIGRHGIGISIAICLLAVHKKGAYAPMDTKVARGLAALGYISQSDRSALTKPTLSKTNLAHFSAIYAGKVLPVWIEQRRTRRAIEIDNGWGSVL